MKETDEGGAGEAVETAAEKCKTERPRDCLSSNVGDAQEPLL